MKKEKKKTGPRATNSYAAQPLTHSLTKIKNPPLLSNQEPLDFSLRPLLPSFEGRKQLFQYSRITQCCVLCVYICGVSTTQRKIRGHPYSADKVCLCLCFAFSSFLLSHSHAFLCVRVSLFITFIYLFPS